MATEQQSKRGGKEPRQPGKRQKTAAGEEGNEKAAEHAPTSSKGSSTSKQPPSQAIHPNTTRRPFFGVIDNVSSFSGIIEGPYDFGFAISITVDRQTFKGVVYKSNSDQPTESAFPDEEVMMNFAAQTQNATQSRTQASAKQARKNSQEEVRLPDITTFHFQHGTTHDSSRAAHPPHTAHDNPRTPHLNHTPHDSPRTPHPPNTPHDSPRTPQDEHSDSDDHFQSPPHSHPPYSQSHSSHSSHPPHSSHAPYHPASHSLHHSDDKPLPAIHSVLQGMNNLSPSGPFSPSSASQSHHPPSTSLSSSSSSAAPLPPQPQLQRQKQRQKKRQEKKLMEMQQQQPARYQSLIDREKSKIPLLGDESLVHAGLEFLQNLDHAK